MNIYQKRWENAVKWAQKINRAIQNGCVVKFEDDEDFGFIDKPLEISDKIIAFRHNENSKTIIFENDKNWDHGLHTEIDEWNNVHQVKFYKEIKEEEIV